VHPSDPTCWRRIRPPASSGGLGPIYVCSPNKTGSKLSRWFWGCPSCSTCGVSCWTFPWPNWRIPTVYRSRECFWKSRHAISFLSIGFRQWIVQRNYFSRVHPSSCRPLDPGFSAFPIRTVGWFLLRWGVRHLSSQSTSWKTLFFRATFAYHLPLWNGMTCPLCHSRSGTLWSSPLTRDRFCAAKGWLWIHSSSWLIPRNVPLLISRLWIALEWEPSQNSMRVWVPKHWVGLQS